MRPLHKSTNTTLRSAPAKDKDNDNPEDDYMSMIIEDPFPSSQHRETLTQRKLRKQRESEAKARIPSKAERAAAEAARRENALNESVLLPSNKGFRMMAKLGFKPGDRLGKVASAGTKTDETTRESERELHNINDDDGNATNERKERKDERNETKDERNETTDWIQSRAEPLRLIIKEDRGGIGLDTERKRKFREEAKTNGLDIDKRVKEAIVDESEYRNRMRAEREERRCEGLVLGAQKVLEKLDTDEIDTIHEVIVSEGERAPTKRNKKEEKEEEKVNVLYRGLIRDRLIRERDKMARIMMENSLLERSGSQRLPTFTTEDEEEEAEEERDQNVAFEFEDQSHDLDIDEEDAELAEFDALTNSEKLEKLVRYLREKYWYCFWCKYRYDSAEMEGCPGVTEEDHD